MGIELLIAAGSLLVGTAAYVSSEESRKEAKVANANSAAEQRKANSEQVAMNRSRAAQEQRQQIREARVRRAKIMQASENTGTDGSSGESGAISGIATQLGSNIGFNLGQIAGQGRANGFAQNGADFQLAAQNALSDASSAQNLFGLSTSIFSANGGTGAFKSTPK